MPPTHVGVPLMEYLVPVATTFFATPSICTSPHAGQQLYHSMHVWNGRQWGCHIHIIGEWAQLIIPPWLCGTPLLCTHGTNWKLLLPCAGMDTACPLEQGVYSFARSSVFENP